jgi:hypothetical protein
VETGKDEIKHHPGATSCHIDSDGRMNDELERICKEEAVILFRNLPAGTRG